MYWIYCIAILLINSLLERARYKEVVFNFSLFTMFIFTSGNYFNGIDWINYQKHYEILHNEGVAGSYLAYEPGFMFIMYFFADLLNIKNFHVVVYFSSLLAIFSLRCFIKRISYPINRSLYLCLFLMVSFPLYNDALRQLIAFCFILPLLSDLKKHSVKKITFTCLFASFFHISSILVIPVLIIARAGLSRKNILDCVIFAFIFLFAIFGLKFILPIIVSNMPAFLQIKLMSYMGKMPDFKLGFFAVIDIIVMLMTYYYAKYLNRTTSLYTYNSCVFLYFLLHFVFYSAPFLQRLLLFIFPIVPLFALMMFSESKKNSLTRTLLPLISMMCFLIFIRNITNPYYSSDFYNPKFFYSEVLFGTLENVKDIKDTKCDVINEIDPDFCPR